jgi:hypothetical protein
MKCRKCGKVVSEEPVKIAFRATCPHCDADLHTCTNCRYFAPGKPNDCAVPGTDFVRDREAANFCEEFKQKTDSPPRPEADKKKFNSLFKDDDNA